MSPPLPRRPLRRYLLGVLAIAHAVPVAVLGVGGSVLYVLGQEERATLRMNEAARSIAIQVANHLEHHLDAVAAIGPELAETGMDGERIGRLLDRTRAAHPGFLTMLVADRRGAIVMGSPATTPEGEPNQGRSVADRHYFRAVIDTGRPYLSGVFRGRGFGSDAIVAASAPIDGPDGLLGVVEGSLSLAALEEAIAVYRWLPGIQIVVADGAGKVVIATETVGLATLESVTLAPGVEPAPSPRRQLLGYVSGLADAGSTGWRVLARWPRRVVHAPTLRFLGLVALLAVGGLIAAAAAATRGARRAVAPLEALVDWTRHRDPAASTAGADATPKGGVSPVATAPEASGIDEVATLTETFRDLYLQLERSNRELQAANAGQRALLAELEERVAARTRELAEREASYRELFEESFGIIASHAPDGTLQSVNPAGAELLGWEPAELVGRQLAELVPADAREEIQRELAALPQRGASEGLIRVTTRGGEERTLLYRNRWVAQAAEPYVVVHALDLTERLRAERVLRHRAFHDPLTGCANRAALEEAVQRAVATHRRQQHRGELARPFALLLLDLDGFKQINDTHGHAAGDRVLCAVAERIRGRIRETDLVARLGGDEFAVLLTDAGGVGDARRVGEDVVYAIGLPVAHAGRSLTVGVSAGLALYPDHGSNVEELLAGADAAMYAAKRDPGMRLRLASPPGAIP